MIKKLKSMLLLITRMKLMRKLLFSYFALILIPLIFITVAFTNFTSRFTSRHIIYSAEQSFDQAYSFLTFKLHNIRETSSNLTKNTEFINILMSSGDKDILSSISTMNSLISYATSIQDGIYVSRVRIYVPDGLMYSDENFNIFNLNRLKNSGWYKDLLQDNRSYKWLPSSYLEPEDKFNNPLPSSQSSDTGDILSLARMIINPNDYRLKLGVIRCDFQKSSIIDILKKANIMDNSVTAIVNSEGELVASSNNELSSRFKLDRGQMISLAAEKDNWSHMTVGNDSYLVGSRLLDSTDWYMVTVLPSSEVLKESNTAIRSILLILILVSTIAIFAAYAISYSFNDRISLLAAKMRDTHNGKLEPLTVRQNNDEISLLIEDYNFMTERMSQLIKEQYKSGQELKNSELKALQAQINPHFLYNTLDMINWYAWNNSGQEIIAIVEDLAKFYKLSLSKGRDIITIEEEISHVSSYFQIQNMRFANLSLTVDVPEEIRQYSIPKITLQPIVENAIIHGILCKESKTGSITITGALEGDVIVLTVSDDGIGIPEEKLSRLQKGEIGAGSENGYGLANINRRIRLQYGEEFGLEFSSQYGEGTSVRVRIPA
jgi:two-component system sensor histidine kinase YesM